MNYVNIKNKVIQLYLIGLKGYFEIDKKHQYGLYKKVFMISSSLLLAKWYIYQIKQEFNKRETPNFLIPKFIYKSRKNCFIYWEMSRIANKLPNLYSYYYYKEDFIFYFDKNGNLKTEKNIIGKERIEQIENPYFEEIIKQYNYNKSEHLKKKGNKLIAYNKFIYDRYDLNNYLHWKTVTLGDWIRGFYYCLMTNMKFTNHYRYDHILYKSEFIYEYEKIKYLLNLYDKDPNKRMKKIEKITEIYNSKKYDIFESFIDMLKYYFI